MVCPGQEIERTHERCAVRVRYLPTCKAIGRTVGLGRLGTNYQHSCHGAEVDMWSMWQCMCDRQHDRTRRRHDREELWILGQARNVLVLHFLGPQ